MNAIKWFLISQLFLFASPSLTLRINANYIIAYALIATDQQFHYENYHSNHKMKTVFSSVLVTSSISASLPLELLLQLLPTPPPAPTRLPFLSHPRPVPHATSLTTSPPYSYSQVVGQPITAMSQLGSASENSIIILSQNIRKRTRFGSRESLLRITRWAREISLCFFRNALYIKMTARILIIWNILSEWCWCWRF